METCRRCHKRFVPTYPAASRLLCVDCMEEILDQRNKEVPCDDDNANQILGEIHKLLINQPDNRIERLVCSPGAALAVAKMTAVCQGQEDIISLNAFRIGAYLAFKQAEIENLMK